MLQQWFQNLPPQPAVPTLLTDTERHISVPHSVKAAELNTKPTWPVRPLLLVRKNREWAVGSLVSGLTGIQNRFPNQHRLDRNGRNRLRPGNRLPLWNRHQNQLRGQQPWIGGHRPNREQPRGQPRGSVLWRRLWRLPNRLYQPLNRSHRLILIKTCLLRGQLHDQPQPLRHLLAPSLLMNV